MINKPNSLKRQILQAIAPLIWKHRKLAFVRKGDDIIKTIRKVPCVPDIKFIRKEPDTKTAVFLKSLDCPLYFEPYFLTLDDAKESAAILKDKTDWVMFIPSHCNDLRAIFSFASIKTNQCGMIITPKPIQETNKPV